MKALESEEYQRQRAMLDEEWRIAERLDDLTPERKTRKEYEYAKLEARHALGWDEGDIVAGLIYRWLTVRNPYHIDLAVMYCHQHGLLPPPVLWRYVGEVATKRFNGDAPTGTPEKITREQIKTNALLLMANLICHGDTDEKAASKAAAHYAELYPSMKPYKASTLLKEYPKRWRKPYERSPFHPDELKKAADALGMEVDLSNLPTPPATMEEAHFQNWREQGFIPDEWREQWRQLRKQLPEADPDLTGERR
ncbi:hypothetical protein QC823_15430 [Halomonas vilamensis]|uniref:Uncharacterized protein n=1 Tax=Vreelandella vilamensis TaxID=531309 RepID=A0ABU1H7S9_9GAMM|nr:hypothetical protein [Halomonas vilamensis]MDR5900356.1 hypothetical protein [Halomonas vilamensis]